MFLLGKENVVGGWVVIVVCGKSCSKMCGKIEIKLRFEEQNWCGSRYGPHDCDSGNKKTKRQKGK